MPLVQMRREGPLRIKEHAKASKEDVVYRSIEFMVSERVTLFGVNHCPDCKAIVVFPYKNQSAVCGYCGEYFTVTHRAEPVPQ